MLKSLFFVVVIMLGTVTAHAFTQDRIFIFTPSLGGSYSNSAKNNFVTDFSLDATYLLAENLEAGLGFALQKTNLAYHNNLTLSPSLPSFNLNLSSSELIVPFYALLKSNIIINSRESVSIYAKIGATLSSQTSVQTASITGSQELIYEPTLYSAIGLDFIYKNMLVGIVYKAVNIHQYMEVTGVTNVVENSNYFNKYVGFRIGYNIYSKVTPVTE